MRIIDFTVPESYELILFGDDQEGNSLKDVKAYESCLQYILNGKNRFAVHMGDEMEAYWIDDPRYSPEILLADPLKQQENVINQLSPLAKSKKLITILYGNHSHKLFPKVGDITADTCRKLDIPYGGFSCVIRFMDKKGVQFKGFFTHGRKYIGSTADDPIRRESNMKLQLKRHLENKAGDCVLMAKGHTHRLLVCEPLSTLYLTFSNKISEHYISSTHGEYIPPSHRWYVNTGSFLRTYGENKTSYSEVMEYDPVEIGYIVVKVEDREIVEVYKEIL